MWWRASCAIRFSYWVSMSDPCSPVLSTETQVSARVNVVASHSLPVSALELIMGQQAFLTA
jgi:hypothetical protein